MGQAGLRLEGGCLGVHLRDVQLPSRVPAAPRAPQAGGHGVGLQLHALRLAFFLIHEAGLQLALTVNHGMRGALPVPEPLPWAPTRSMQEQQRLKRQCGQGPAGGYL